MVTHAGVLIMLQVLEPVGRQRGAAGDKGLRRLQASALLQLRLPAAALAGAQGRLQGLSRHGRFYGTCLIQA